MLEIVEHPSESYPPRTYKNAKEADLTAAFALKFDTAGERLTQKAAGDRYIAISLDEDVIEAARILFRALRHHNAKILNIAGNGIYTLAPTGWTQDRLNLHLLAILAKVHQHWALSKVISGGQTGVDLAGVTAAHALGIYAVATLPKGCLQRGLDNKDKTQSASDVRQQVEDGVALLKIMLGQSSANEPNI